MIRITASHGRKVPDPTEQYATRSFFASIEAEICDGDPATMIARLKTLWNDLEAAVDERIGARVQTTGNGRNGSNGSGAPQVEPETATGNGNGSNALSGKQKNYLLGLGSKRGWRVGRLNEELQTIVGRIDATLHSLDRHEASLAIEVLKGEQA